MADDERRKSERVAATVKIALDSHDLHEFHELYTANLGRGGVFVQSKTFLEVGSPVHFEVLCRGQEQPLTGEAVVVWTRAADPQRPELKPGVGLRFVSLSAESQALIEQIVKSQASNVEELLHVDSSGEEISLEPAAKEKAKEDSLVTLPTSYSVNDTIIGIDLGTSNSCVAVVHRGKPVIIPNENGNRTIPSVVAFTKKGEVLVGKAAKDQLCIDPRNTVYGAKRFIGRPFNSPMVNTLRDYFPYELIPGEKGQVAIAIREENITLERISAQILNYLQLIAQEFIELEVNKAIISVPAYYNDNQRQAVKDAGRMAGLDVQRIVNEPTSAALAYGFNRGFHTRILVYDLGGGTFDVSVLELNGNSFEVVACGGNNFLGGEDFDNAITKYLVTTYEKQHGVKIAEDLVTRQRLKQGAEHAKQILSENSRTTVNIPYLKTADGKGVNLQMPLTRDIVNQITKELVDRTLKICDDVLAGIGMKKQDLDEVILVGGQTRMPFIRGSIRHHFGKEPRTDLNPEEVVAQGAALLGGSMNQLENLKLRDAISITIGIGLPGGRFKPIIKANTSVPTVKQYRISASTKQKDFSIDVFQGEAAEVRKNEYLGTLLFSDLAVGKDDKVPLKIEFRVTEECILRVVATDESSGQSEEALLVTYDTPPTVRDQLEEGSEESSPD